LLSDVAAVVQFIYWILGCMQASIAVVM
jgi:hypothetical protein